MRAIGSKICTVFMSAAVAVAALTVATTANGTGPEDVSTAAPLAVFKECAACPEMITLPLGEFAMGSTSEEARAAYMRFSYYNEKRRDTGFATETPKRRIEIDLPIAMGRTEVTRRQWAQCVADQGCLKGRTQRPRGDWIRCMNASGCALTPDDRVRFSLQKGPHQWHPDSPIVGITFPEMQEYVAWLNDKVGHKVYRLPTEPEWEYAARAGTTSLFAQGDRLTRARANYAVVRREFVDGKPVFHSDPSNELRPIPVDALDAANPWGLRHMQGNVGEMTRSCWTDRHVGLLTTSRHLAASYRPLGCERVTCGGFYGGPMMLSRPARRTPRSEDGWSPWIGFRVLRDMTVPVVDAGRLQ